MKKGNLIRTLLFAMSLFIIVGCTPTHTTRSTGQYIDDATITSKVKIALVKNEHVSATRVKVNTYKGVVQLSGFVKSKMEINAAIKSARSVSGVRSVVNQIQIR